MELFKKLSACLALVHTVDCVVRLETKLGSLIGSRRALNTTHLSNVASEQIDIFIGVPYAQPPIKNLRYVATQPVKAWRETRNATLQAVRTRCPTFAIFRPGDRVHEDCLQLNIYSPFQRRYPARRYPVMVYIHGGSYYAGSAHDYDGSVLASKGTVVVIINYRLGSLGLLSSGDDRIPGNFGILDQIESLKWVQKYIHHFRGDPGKVTIFGNSAGGSSVGILLLSPLAKDLFHGLITQSGPVTAFWAVHQPADCDMKIRFDKQMEALGCPSGSGEKALACLQELDIGRIPGPTSDADGDTCGALLHLKPWVDGHVIPLHPDEALKTGQFNQVPTIIGTVTHEWAYNVGWTRPNGPGHLPKYLDVDEGVERKEFLYWVNSLKNRFPHFEGAVDFIVFEYTNWTDPESPITNRDEIIQLMSDITMTAPSTRMADLVSKHVDTYYYVFAHTHKPGIEVALETRLVNKAYHQIELNFLFGEASGYKVYADLVKKGKSQYTPSEVGELEDRITNTWSLFAKQGNPNEKHNVTWTPYNPTNRGYLSIDSHASTMKSSYQLHRMSFWNEVIEPRRERVLSSSKGMSMEKIAMWTLFSFCLFLVLVVVILVCFLRRMREINKHASAQRYSTNSRKQLTIPT